ncbi:hypothetical protein BN1184_BN_00210 [Pantoea ananatis]|nr:hypothetical protein BN1182_BY_00200 [Pantoea ananatis]CRH35132.1 hypothetical protein BN1183_CE_00210 [Pantoea ananatis]CRH39580.1 hypothetical protein BN1184_BN_00210 [Pantoea ananatis]
MTQSLCQRLNTRRVDAIIVAEQYPHLILTFSVQPGRRYMDLF